MRKIIMLTINNDGDHDNDNDNEIENIIDTITTTTTTKTVRQQQAKTLVFLSYRIMRTTIGIV